MELATERRGAALVVRVEADRIDAAVAIRFKEEMRAVLAGAGTPVILDLGRVGFLDSSGLGAVVAVMKLLGPERPLELAALTPPVEKVFRLTRMDRIFTIHPEVPPAGDGAVAGRA